MPDPIPFNTGSESPEAPRHPDDRVYTSEEVSEIIRVALESSEAQDRDSVTHEELLAIGRDFGLSEPDLYKAFDRVNQSRVVADHAGKAWLTFKLHAICFVVVNLGLFGINVLTGAPDWWVLYPIVSWGTVVALHGILAKYIPTVIANWMFEGWGYSRNEGHLAFSGGSDPNVAAFSNELYEGLAEASGIARVEGDALYLEFQVADAIFGGLRSKVREVIIPLQDIASVRLTRGIRSNKLILQGNRVRTFESVPGRTSANELRLSFSGATRPASERLARQIADGIQAGVAAH